MRAWLLLPLGIIIGAGAYWWVGQLRNEPTLAEAIAAAGTEQPRPRALSASTRAPVTITASAPADRADMQATTSTPEPGAAMGAPEGAGPTDALLIPVEGVTPAQLQDTFTDARSEGRVHDAIDIMAPDGTPVVAVADGHIEKLFDSKRGGLTIYQFDPSGTWCYYYAHLQRYADGLAEQQQVRRGQVIGYVGSTGNADPAGPHLHFEVHRLGAERQWWKGDALNPYPLLHDGHAPQ